MLRLLAALPEDQALPRPTLHASGQR